MAESESIRKSGQAFIASAFAFITILTGSDPIAIPGSIVAASLMAIGMSGLRSGYRESISPLGNKMLLLGMAGPILWGVAMLSMVMMATAKQVQEGWWVFLFSGPAFSLLGLTLFGLTTFGSKVMPRLNWLPLFTGIWYPATFTLFSIYDISHKGVFPDQSLPALVFMAVVQFLVLCLFGFVLMTNSGREGATTL